MQDAITLFSGLAGLDGASRPHRLALATGEALLVERWSGHEQLSDGFQWWVDVLANDATLDVATWLGLPATLSSRQAGGHDALRSGVVCEAACVAADGGLARYRLCLVPWTWLMGQGRQSRVFQERMLLDILQAVLDPYAAHGTWRVSDEVADLLAAVPRRSYCVQYRESDLDFLQRLLAEEGLGWRIEEDPDAPASHALVIFADSSAQPQDATSARDGGLRFHRADATEATDSVLALGRSRRIGVSALVLASDDYVGPQGRQAQTPVLSAQRGNTALEAYTPVGAYAFANRTVADHYSRLAAQAHESRSGGWLGSSTAPSLRAGTWTSVRQWPLSDRGGAPVVLVTQVWHQATNNLPTAARLALQQRLGEAPAWPMAGRDDAARQRQLRIRADALGYANAFEGVDRAVAWRPVRVDGTGLRLNPRPLAPGYQTARVIAADGNDTGEVSCDALGRIKVRFHFQAVGSGDDGSSWLRVAQRYAGPGVGAQFLPRVGQEVLVAFLDGDIDRPLIVGTLYNGRGEAGVAATPAGTAASNALGAYAQAGDGRSSAQGNLAGGHAPAWHAMGAGDDAHRNPAALWGIQSREWQGKGHSRLLFDDSDGQLRLQLATTHASTQLNLGHLIHQADNFRGSLRGEGNELRTDAWGAVRARAGLWLSAQPHAARAPAGEAVAPGALLTQLNELGRIQHQAARVHRSVAVASHIGVAGQQGEPAPLAGLLRSTRTTVSGDTFDSGRAEAPDYASSAGQGRLPHTGDATLGLSASDGLVQVAGQSLQWAVGEVLGLASGQASECVVQGQARVHGGQAIGVLAATIGTVSGTTLSVVSGQGELIVQAQDNQILVQARESLRAASAGAAIEMAAPKTVHIATAGGASITLAGGNLTVTCPGNITVHAGRKSFVGPANLTYPLPTMPRSESPDVLPSFAFRLQDIPGPQGIALAGQPWKIVRTRQAGSDTPDNLHAVDAGQWAEILKEGSADDDGKVELSNADCKTVWDAVARFPGRLYLVHGIDAIPLQMRQFSTGPGVREMVETLDANNYSKDLQHLPDADALRAIRHRVEYEFQSLLTTTPKQRKEI
ncbi:type VI secretion system tip protein VgrG [Bacillus subtilis subsp. subtilis]|nr:type VI secretion system tip protein VgrG [Bacillus subtilis subsp. subtilis]